MASIEASIVLTGNSITDQDICEAFTLKVRVQPPDSESENPVVFYNMRYVPPYEKFNDLKELVLLMYDAKGLQSDYKGIVCIDATDWIRHFNEEYFEVVLKYMADHKNGIYYLIMIRNQDIELIKPLFMAIMQYLTINLKRLPDKIVSAEEIIVKELTENGIVIEKSMVNQVLKTLRENAVDIGKEEVMKSLVFDLVSYARRRGVNYLSRTDMELYALEETTLFGILMEEKAVGIREEKDAYTL